jgi:hypothetical protein
MATINTNNGHYDTVTVPGIGACEKLTATSLQLLADVRTDTVDQFVAAHPDWVSHS